MDEREELLKRDREREKRREQRRLAREKEVKKKKMIAAASAGAVLVLIILVSLVGTSISKKAKAEEAKEKARQEAQALKKQQEENTVEILAVGDNIAHEAVRDSGTEINGVMNYDQVYQAVKEDVEAADLAIVTQETIFVEDENDVSGYPSFGTPTAFGDALVDTGFDVIASATNHTLDKGTDSINFTVDWWKQNHPDTVVLGIHKSQEEADEITIVPCKGLKIAMVDYTYSLNGLELPQGEDYLVDVFDEDKAREDIRRAKELGDVVVAVMHVGIEYDQDIDEETQAWTDLFLEEGVDIVIGSHPHVVRTMEMLTGEDGHQMLVYYSLGNFIATQNDLPSIMGAMAKITVRKDVETGEIQFPQQEFIPLISHYNRDTPEAAVYKLEDYTQELLERHSAYAKNPGQFTLEYYQDLFEEIKAKGNGGTLDSDESQGEMEQDSADEADTNQGEAGGDSVGENGTNQEDADGNTTDGEDADQGDETGVNTGRAA